MANLGDVFNAHDVVPGEARDFSAMPPGRYTVQIINSDVRNVKPKSGQDPNGYYGKYVWLEIEVAEGQFERRKLFENLTLDHQNPKTVEIARQRLREICLAVGKPNLQDTSDLHNIMFYVDLIVEPDNRTKSLPVGDPNKLPAVNRIRACHVMDPNAAAAVAASRPAQPAQTATTAGAGGGSAFGGAGGAGAALPPRSEPAQAPGALPWG